MTVNPHQTWTASEIMEATGGTLLQGKADPIFDGIGIDSRSIAASDCFLALRGEVHDGHAFVPEVLARGVRGIIVQQGSFDASRLKTAAATAVCIAVADTLAALGALAAYHRRRSRASVAAITGSNGKTSTRTMTAAVLSQRFDVLTPQGNFNNEVGLPLTLLRLQASHDWAVLELGMNHPGEISRLADICRPDIGLITNIGPAHLEGLGSLEGVMHAKGELLEKVAPGGTMILNADDPMTAKLLKKKPTRPLLFGLAAEADVRATDLSAGAAGIFFTLHAAGEQVPVTLQVPAKFMVHNALAAAAVGHAVGLSPADIAAALAQFRPIKGRLNLLRAGGNLNLIDDTYNANPASVKAALAALGDLKADGRGLVVLGDMLELGAASRELHREVGSFAARAGVAKLYACGEFADALIQGAREGGLLPENTFAGTKEAILEDLVKNVKPRDWLLVKGSRGMHMETLVAALREELEKERS